MEETTGPLRVGRVGDILDAPVGRHPAHPAVVAANGTLSYGELDAAADRAAGVMWEWGVRQHQVVGVSLPNALEIVVVFHALMRLGAVFLGINRNLALPEREYMLRDAEARLLVTDSLSAATLGHGDGLSVLVVEDDGFALWRERPGRRLPTGYQRAGCGFDDPAGLAYTSGTTGRPKGVLHSHRNLLVASAALVADRGYSSDLIRGDCTALTILNLQVTSTLLAATAGGTQVVMNRVDPVGIAEWVRRVRINSWFGVPTMLYALATSPEVSPGDLATLEDVWTGGAHLPDAVRRAFEERFGIKVHATYGMTEVPTVVAIEPRHGSAVPESSGRPLQHLLVEIRDDAGTALPAGRSGEITVRGWPDGPWGGLYTPMLCYLGHAEATASTVRDGALMTGDIGSLDGSGHLHVLDRRRSVIIRGGANVYPAEVERILSQVPGVVGCAVVGIPDERLGEKVGAAVETDPDVEVSREALVEHCQANLARYKVPEEWRFAELPRNTMGKVILPDVRRLFA